MRALFLLAALSACSAGATFQRGVFRNEQVRYRVGTLPAAWRWVALSGGQVAFVHRETAAAISAHAVCGRADAPLKVLTRHLLIGLTERRVLGQRLESLDGREALVSHVAGKLDGVPVEMDLVVLKKDGCTFDLTYTAAPDRFEDRREDFRRFVREFRKLPLNGSAP